METESLNQEMPPQPPKSNHFPKVIVIILGIVLLTTIIIAVALFIKNSKPKVIQPPPKPALNKIEVSPDDKSIVNSETKKVIFTIEDAINYIKSSGIEINPDNQATYGGKCNEDCLVAAALSNRKGSIVFSAVWFPKGLASRPWIGVYNLPVECPAISNTTCQLSPSSFQFLMASNGINFAWSQDDKTITYDGGMDVYISPETRTIDANNGKLLEIKPPKGTTPGGNVYKNEKYGFELTFPDNWTSYNVSEDNGWVYKNLGFNYLSVLLRVNGNLVDLPSYQDIFAIGIFSEKDWNEKNTENNPARFTYLAKNKDYYFGYVISKFSGNFVGVKSNNELPSEVEQVLSTFKFIGQDQVNKAIQPTITSTPKQNNEERNIQIQAILNNIYFYAKDKAHLPPEITETDQSISSNGANICPYIISDAYGLPMDPKLGDGSKITKCPATYNTGYLIKRDPQGRVTVSAPYAENSETIVVSR